MAVEVSETTLVCRNPATLEKLAEIPVSDACEVQSIIAAAGEAFRSWRKVPLSARLEPVEQFRRLAYERREELAGLITSEVGKPRVEALVSEVFPVLEICTWLKKKAPQVLLPEPVRLNPLFFAGKRSYNVLEPVGVVAVISPWNYPLSIPATTMLSALAMGNAVVLKPSPRSALVAARLVELFNAAGFPRGLVGLVQGDRQQAEQVILGGVNRVMFTGSVQGGRAVMGIAAKKLVPVTLELGGKHAAVVLSDSDVDAIAPVLLWGGMTNAGQACASVERILAEAPVAEKLAARIAELARQLRVGDGAIHDTDVGPLIDPGEKARIQVLVDDAVQRGARLLCGGRPLEEMGACFYEPTVLDRVPPDAKIAREEIFGPVIPVITAGDEKEAIRLVNDSNLGLGASIWTRDIPRAERLAREVEAGIVWINDGLYSHVCPDAPWGGIKESGFGRAHSTYELIDLCYVKNVGVSSQGDRDWTFPYSAGNLDYVRGGLSLLHAGALGERAKALWAVLCIALQKRR